CAPRVSVSHAGRPAVRERPTRHRPLLIGLPNRYSQQVANQQVSWSIWDTDAYAGGADAPACEPRRPVCGWSTAGASAQVTPEEGGVIGRSGPVGSSMSLLLGEAAAWRDPGMGLAGDGGNVLEVSVVVQDGSAVVLCDGCGDQVDDTRCTVVPTGGHPDLDIPGPLGNHLGDRQHDVETLTPLGDNTDVGKVTTGITSLQVDRYARSGGAVHDEPCYDFAHSRMPDPGLRGRVDQVELARAGRQRHRRACRMTSASAMSGPTPRAYGSSSNCSIRRRLLATNSSAAFTVSFFVVVPSSLAARSSASSFRSIIVFIYTIILPGKHQQQHCVWAADFTPAPTHPVHAAVHGESGWQAHAFPLSVDGHRDPASPGIKSQARTNG